MRKLYGDSLRKDAGFVKVIKTVATKNAKLFESRAGRHAPHIRRVAKEVKVTFDKAIEETAEAVEEFFAKCKRCIAFFSTKKTTKPISPLAKPRITEVVEDTKVLIRQSRERFILS
jgi:phosphatidylethanolamine N-methyltransferase